jgi:peptidyl-prolyl cis-trans isomerase C
MAITVNGERITSEEISAAAADFRHTSDPIDTAARALTARMLLRQRSVALKIKAVDEETALEKLLEREVIVPQVSDDDVRRYYAEHLHKFHSGDVYEARHILFADTPEGHAKATDLLRRLQQHPEKFERAAQEHSACASAAHGGRLGALLPGSVTPEFWEAMVAFGKPGLLPELLQTRHGLHIVLIDRAAAGGTAPVEAAETKIRQFLSARLSHMAYKQYISRLAAQARITGIDLISVNAPTL